MQKMIFLMAEIFHWQQRNRAKQTLKPYCSWNMLMSDAYMRNCIPSSVLKTLLANRVLSLGKTQVSSTARSKFWFRRSSQAKLHAQNQFTTSHQGSLCEPQKISKSSQPELQHQTKPLWISARSSGLTLKMLLTGCHHCYFKWYEESITMMVVFSCISPVFKDNWNLLCK